MVIDVVGIFLAGLLLGVVLIVLIGGIRMHRMRASHRTRLNTFGPDFSGPAVLFGLASDGPRQSRGAGTLALNSTRLLFVQLVPEREIMVDRDCITSVSTSGEFMGKTAPADMLVITWLRHGAGDAAAFSCEDVWEWQRMLASFPDAASGQAH